MPQKDTPTTPSDLTQEELDARVIELFNADSSIRDIAKTLKISWQRARRVLDSAGLSPADRVTRKENNAALRKAANAEHLEQIRAQRIELAALLMQDSFRMRERIWSDYTTFAQGVEGPVEITMDEPPLKEQADGAKAIEATMRVVDNIMASVTDTSNDNSAAVLTTLLTSLQDIVDQDPTIGLDDNDQEPDLAPEDDEDPFTTEDTE